MKEMQRPEELQNIRVWLLADDRPGNTTQSVGLAQALGWPYEIKQLHFTGLANLRNRWLRTYGAMLAGLDKKLSAPLCPPWPDLVISAGLRTAPVARWIKKQSDDRTVIVQLGRKGGQIADLFDAVVTCGYAQFPPHPRRIETTVPLTRITDQNLAAANQEWAGLFKGAPSPRVALLAGGSTARHRFDANTAGRLGEDLAKLTADVGGSIFAITSRRTGKAAEDALQEGLGPDAHFQGWDPSSANPYLALLGAADVIVVTGESESMLAEAAISGKPVYIYEIPELPLSRTSRLGNWVAKRARGRHKQGRAGALERLLEWACERLITKGLVRPPRDLHKLHEMLIRAGVARRFGEPLDLWSPPPINEMAMVVGRVKALILER